MNVEILAEREDASKQLARLLKEVKTGKASAKAVPNGHEAKLAAVSPVLAASSCPGCLSTFCYMPTKAASCMTTMAVHRLSWPACRLTLIMPVCTGASYISACVGIGNGNGNSICLSACSRLTRDRAFTIRAITGTCHRGRYLTATHHSPSC